MNERIKKLRKTLDLTQQEFADRIGIARGNIGAYEVNKNAPSDAVISLICKTFNVNEEWLRNGTGEMFIQKTLDDEIAAWIGRIQMEDGDNFKKRLIAMLSRMTETEWEMVEKKAIEIVEGKEKD